MIIVIDGPAGTGKSSVAQRIADSWNIAYIDTGAMYRMLTLFCIQKEIDIYDEHSLKEVLDSFVFDIAIVNGKQAYFLGDEDVTEKIRSLEVSKKVSHVSELSEVRKKLVVYQRKAAQKGSCVFEGRDMGTVVFPDADIKVFLTASSEVRAERRFKESQGKGVCYEEVLENIIERDSIDMKREISPLMQAEDAILIDTTNYSIEDVVDSINKLVSSKK